VILQKDNCHRCLAGVVIFNAFPFLLMHAFSCLCHA